MVENEKGRRGRGDRTATAGAGVLEWGAHRPPGPGTAPRHPAHPSMHTLLAVSPQVLPAPQKDGGFSSTDSALLLGTAAPSKHHSGTFGSGSPASWCLVKMMGAGSWK